jgi:hypothetical protein
MKVTTRDWILFREVDVAVPFILFAEAPTTQRLP